MRLILASKSRSRSEMLLSAGLDIDCIPSDLDEDPIKTEGLSVEQTALKLAFAKAKVVSDQHLDAIVIGADQMLSFGEERLDKARDLQEVRHQLKKMRGKTHSLHSAVSILKEGHEIFSTIKAAHLNMRDFSDPFLEHYIEEKGNDLLETVGCYRLESTGVQLFSKIEGDYFTILGLPLLEVLAFLRAEKIMEN